MTLLRLLSWLLRRKKLRMPDTNAVQRISAEIAKQRAADVEAGYDMPGIHRDNNNDTRWWNQSAKRQLIQNAETSPAQLTWDALLQADFYMIRGSETPADRRQRLIEMAATIVANIDDIDRRQYAALIKQPELASLKGEADADLFPKRTPLRIYSTGAYAQGLVAA